MLNNRFGCEIRNPNEVEMGLKSYFFQHFRPSKLCKIGVWVERFGLGNGGCSSGKWLPRGFPVEVNDVDLGGLNQRVDLSKG